MSDTTGDRPADHNPENAVPQTPPAPPAPQQPQQQQQPAYPASPAAPQQQQPQAPAGWQAPGQQQQRPAYPGYPQQYGVPHPQAYAGQPGQQGQPAHPAHPGQPYASSFGPGAHQTQPTAPLGAPVTGAVPTTTATKQKSGAGKVVGLIVAAAIVGGAAGLGGAYAGVNVFGTDGSNPAAGPTTVTVNDTDSVNQTTGIAAKVLPSVVTIAATSSSGGGTGSGVVLTEDGYVVTNTHVVTLDGATADAEIKVTTSDGKVYKAEIVGTDPTYDLAVIKLVDAEGLTPVEFADSSKLNVGDETVAIGAPLGLSNTVTTGIISALNRSIQIASSAAPDGDSDNGGETPDQGGQSPFQFDFGQGQTQQRATESISISVIQTDAAINPGNSGGALVDGEGKLIGINVAIASAGGSAGQSGNIGVGFSIPSEIVKRVTSEIIDTGKATHGLLGASVQDAASVEDATITGAYIAEVVDGGAAAAAGLEKGDIVTEFNGVPVTDATDLTAQVRAAAGGSDAKLTYVRGGDSQTVTVTLGTLGE
ncbi:trypsin-like peptidase domain-containing protein [Microbacterium sp. BK668]|uniref:trypsin-like peptidase domain-containing protein n=1 Tax=Microbacterium sp. BK668 TaxID=2512118 RepID=UPI00105EB82B|nr:trypsin-like peptidase domain-containing protein [Microbacterium sp. BK668]TDN92529.1 putative serine protease PepD [Microbacterium sp. BK668]